jgi:hypothetical protein
MRMKEGKRGSLNRTKIMKKWEKRKNERKYENDKGKKGKQRKAKGRKKEKGVLMSLGPLQQTSDCFTALFLASEAEVWKARDPSDLCINPHAQVCVY